MKNSKHTFPSANTLDLKRREKINKKFAQAEKFLEKILPEEDVADSYSALGLLDNAHSLFFKNSECLADECEGLLLFISEDVKKSYKNRKENCEWGDEKLIDRLGYDFHGYNSEGFDRCGFNSQGRDKWGFDREGYDLRGYDRYGLDRNKEKKKT